MNRPLPVVRSLPLADLSAAYPQLRFAVRFADGHQQGHDAGARHPLAGIGKLVLACAVARLAAGNPDLLGERLTLTGVRRVDARSGTLRLMSGELTVTVDDAMALIVGTGDARCVLALLDHLRDRAYDVVGEARAHVTALGLENTEIMGLETDDHPDGAHSGRASWGEGLTGTTTPADLCTVLASLPEPVLGWMGAAFEPAGLASGLPGFGPRTVPHRTVAGGAGPTGEAPGWASVLVLPGAMVAARLAAEHPDGTAVTPLEASAALGTLGLAVWQGLSA
ncbi:serine hydrolase [Microbacterium sp. A93]|uniref:serine hydrolase n=1 Tax=Microbacterium sp. A93 TaxID=3450716 RepID=UPI003F428F0E